MKQYILEELKKQYSILPVKEPRWKKDYDDMSEYERKRFNTKLETLKNA